MNLKTSLTGFVCAVAFLAANEAKGQVGINTTTPDSNSALDIVDTKKGVLIPRMNQTQANSLAALIPADGMLIYNSTAQCVQIYKRTSPTAGAFDCLVVVSGSDNTNDAWINDNPNTQVKLGTLSNGAATRPTGTEFVIKDDGKVGIGNPNPQWSLDILGERAIGQIKRVTENNASANNSAGFIFSRARGSLTAQTDILAGDYLGKLQFSGNVGGGNSNFGTFAYLANSTTAGDGRFAFFKELSSTEVMSIYTSTGNVGIGTTTPQKRLHVNGGIQLTNELNVGGNATTAGSSGTAGQVLVSGGSNAAPTWSNVSSIGDSTNDAWINDNTNTQVKLGTLSDGTTARPTGTDFVATNDGKIGIGTSAPTSKLHVNDISGTGRYFILGEFYAPANVAADYNTTLRFGVTNTSKNSGDLRFNYKANSDDTNSIDLGFNGIASPRMSIQAGGNVGIGTTAPSATLDVNGNVEIVTVDNVPTNTTYKPLVWNTSTKRVETTADNSSIRRVNANVASGDTVNVGSPFTGSTSGFISLAGTGYEIKIVTSNACGVSTYNKFLATGTSIANYWKINYISGVSENGPSSGSVSGNGSSVAVTNPLSGGCADGGNANAHNYTVNISNSGQLSITNNGNVNRTYKVIIEKVVD